MGCQKISSTDVEEKIKPVYQTTMIRKELIEVQFQSLYRAETKWAKVYATCRH